MIRDQRKVIIHQATIINNKEKNNIVYQFTSRNWGLGLKKLIIFNSECSHLIPLVWFYPVESVHGSGRSV